MDVYDTGNAILSIEVFAAKDSLGTLKVMLTVPCRCGLKSADTLRIDGSTMVAMRARSILPLDFPALTIGSREKLAYLAALGQRLAVGEFTPLGLSDAYFLEVVVGS